MPKKLSRRLLRCLGNPTRDSAVREAAYAVVAVRLEMPTELTLSKTEWSEMVTTWFRQGKRLTPHLGSLKPLGMMTDFAPAYW